MQQHCCGQTQTAEEEVILRCCCCSANVAGCRQLATCLLQLFMTACIFTAGPHLASFFILRVIKVKMAKRKSERERESELNLWS